ncbi:hypothetical protein CPB86DRAFT_779125 [Serendipita vermifera]|nr:hypothetical protein CPB86DRAFT_779125 [Serendipita vermifera]
MSSKFATLTSMFTQSPTNAAFDLPLERPYSPEPQRSKSLSRKMTIKRVFHSRKASDASQSSRASRSTQRSSTDSMGVLDISGNGQQEEQSYHSFLDMS